MSGTHPDLWPLPPTVRAGRTMTHKKSPAGRGGRRGSWEWDLGSGRRSPGSPQGRGRSVTDIASVTGHRTSVVQGKRGAVRVDLGGGRNIKKKTRTTHTISDQTPTIHI